MSLGQVLAQQETSVSDARISQLSECKFLSEQEVIELAAKCKVGGGVGLPHMRPHAWQCMGDAATHGLHTTTLLRHRLSSSRAQPRAAARSVVCGATLVTPEREAFLYATSVGGCC